MYNKPSLGFLVTTEAECNQCPTAGCNVNINQPPKEPIAQPK